MSRRCEPAPPGSGARRRVLIVDDEPDSAMTMALLLTKLGADVETAYDGPQAVDAAARFEPQVVLLDIGLPLVDGFEVARRIREKMAGRQVSFVAMTGWARDADLRRSKEAGFDHHLVKPVDSTVLERLLADLPPAVVPRAPAGSRGAAADPTALVAEMSHEIRTPLNSLAGTAHLLLGSPLNAEQRGLVETLLRSSESLRDVVDNFVDLASAESGTLGLDEWPFRPAVLVEECLALAGRQAAQKGLDVTCVVEPSVPESLIGDAARIRRMIVHLVRSALRATAAGGVTVSVSSSPGGDDSIDVHVCVRDTRTHPPPGPLLPQPDARDPSQGWHRRGDAANLRAARMLSERMGGRMWDEAGAASGGACHFTFVANLALAPVQAPPPGARRVLVADDDPVSRRLAVLLLSELALVADVAASGDEAVVAVSRTAYDVVLVDARMPGMDGVETVREIRRVAPPPQGPSVIAMTASVSRRDRKELLAAGAAVCLTKPLTADALRAALSGVRSSPAQGAAAVSDGGDLDQLIAIRASNPPEIVDRLVGLYLEDTPVQMARLRQAAGSGDARKLERVAHLLRGSSASIGATRMQSLASDVEARSRRGELGAAGAALEALEGAWLVTRGALEQSRRAQQG